MMEQQLLNQYVTGLTTYINGLYDAIVTIDGRKYQSLPLIEVKSQGLTDFSGNETLSYQETKFNLAYEINIYSQDINTVSGDIIGDDVVVILGQKVLEYFRSEGFGVRTNQIISNIDPTVSRKFIRVTGIYDTNREVIYRN